MTEVIEARADYDQARKDAKELVDRARAKLGLAIHEARVQHGNGAQTAAMAALKKSREQVRAFEKAYREWVRDHEGESLTP